MPPFDEQDKLSCTHTLIPTRPNCSLRTLLMLSDLERSQHTSSLLRKTQLSSTYSRMLLEAGVPGIYDMSKGLEAMISKAPSKPDNPIVPPACATWELGYVRGWGKIEEGQYRGFHCFRINCSTIRYSKEPSKKAAASDPCWRSAQHTLCSPSPQAGSCPRGAGRSLFFLRFPCWLGISALSCNLS